MKPNVEIVKSEDWHAMYIAEKARDADVNELWASSRTTPIDAMRRGMATSTVCYTGMIDGVPVCMFGASPFSALAGKGVAWMIGSRELDEMTARKELLRHSREAVDYLSHLFPTLLFNFVDERNTAAIRWLRWLGFQLDTPIPYGDDKLPFIPFYMTREN